MRLSNATLRPYKCVSFVRINRYSRSFRRITATNTKVLSGLACLVDLKEPKRPRHSFHSLCVGFQHKVVLKRRVREVLCQNCPGRCVRGQKTSVPPQPASRHAPRETGTGAAVTDSGGEGQARAVLGSQAAGVQRTATVFLYFPREQHTEPTGTP